MNSKISSPFIHFIYWLVVWLMLFLLFGRSWQNNLHAMFFVSMLLPVVMGTSYFFNYVLVPRFLLKKEYVLFSLYLFYTIVISLYLQMIVVFFSYVYMVNMNFEDVDPRSRDILLLALVMYLIVFVSSFLIMLKQLNIHQLKINAFNIQKEKQDRGFLEIISNRKKMRIPYDEIVFIESMADYIKVNTKAGKEIVSKEKISRLNDRLPDIFIRVHRSFIVNKDKILNFSYNEIELGSTILTIGRNYKKEVMNKLKSNIPKQENAKKI